MPSSAKSCLLIAAATAVLVAVGHAWSIRSGLFLDDHVHYQHLKQTGWSYRQLTDASRLDIVGDVMDLWFADQAGLRFYRPLAFLLMKIEYAASRWQPTGMHLFSLLWHWLCALLVGYLASLSIGRRIWAAIAAGIFALHPAHVVTVQWIACQTELMVTFFTLAAVICYWHYAGWPTAQPTDQAPTNPPRRPGPRLGWLVAVCAAYIAALGCRENAVAIPALLLAGDLLLARRRLRPQLPAYALLAVLTVAFLLLRHHALGGFPLPGRPYLVGFDDPDFLGFVCAKFAYCLLALFAFLPVLPIGGLVYFRAHPAILWTGFTAVLAALLLLSWALRRRLNLTYWLLWIVLSLGPMLAVFCSPHHLYLPAVGMAIISAAALAALAGRWHRRTTARPAATFAVIALAAVQGLLCWAYSWAYRASTAVEDLLVTEVVDYGPQINDGDTLFFINLPLAGYYATPAIEQATGCDKLHGYALTIAPSVLRMNQPCRITKLSPTRLSIRLDQGRYFAGALGNLARQLQTTQPALSQGRRISHGPFEVTIAQAGPEGVQELIFEFAKPLASPDYHFFLGSRLRLAGPLDMNVLPEPTAIAKPQPQTGPDPSGWSPTQQQAPTY